MPALGPTCRGDCARYRLPCKIRFNEAVEFFNYCCSCVAFFWAGVMGQLPGG